MMTPEEQKYVVDQEARIRAAEAGQQNVQANQIQTGMALQQEEMSITKEQLDNEKDLQILEHTLKGEVREEDEKGRWAWKLPADNDSGILSDYGVRVVMQALRMYVGKGLLLSNYKEEVIDSKMEDFASDLNDDLFMKYELVFKYPTFEDCKQVLLDRLARKKKGRMFALELLGTDVDEAGELEIEDALIKELEGKIESELEKIKQQIVKNKLKGFPLLMREVQDVVHNAYLRALKGEERRTIRQHTHITESRNTGMPQPAQRKGPLSFLRGK